MSSVKAWTNKNDFIRLLNKFLSVTGSNVSRQIVPDPLCSHGCIYHVTSDRDGVTFADGTKSAATGA